MLPIVNSGSMAEPTSAPSKPPHAPYVGALPILDVVALKSEYDRHVSFSLSRRTNPYPKFEGEESEGGT
jgi:hypothetical protein